MLIKKLLLVALSDFVKMKQLKMKLCQMQMRGLAKAKMSVLDRRQNERRIRRLLIKHRTLSCFQQSAMQLYLEIASEN